MQLGLHNRCLDDKLKKDAFDQLWNINSTYDHKDSDLSQSKYLSAELFFFFSKFIADTTLQLYSCSVHLTPANQWNFVPSERHFCHHPILICLPYCPKHNWMLRKSYIGEVLCHEQLMPLCNCLVPTLHSICLVMMWVGVINNCLHEHIFSFFNQLIACPLY